MHTGHTACTPSATVYYPDGANEEFRVWHHGYAAGVILRAVALAYKEAADNWSDLPDFPEFAAGTELFRATSALLEYRAKNLAPTAYDTVVEICSGLLQSGRALIGAPFGSPRLDYLLCRIANQQAGWIEPLKRRKNWLGERRTDND